MTRHSIAGSIGVFGGMFDPVHYGHLRTAYELSLRLGLGEIRFIPCAVPPHRGSPDASPELRVRMLRAAIGAEPSFVIDERELARTGPSYTIDTLASLRAEFPAHSLSLMIGMDEFLGLPGWKDWERLPELAHIVVAHRPGAGKPRGGAIGALLRARGTDNGAAIAASPAGHVFVTGVTQLRISSTELKESLRAGVPPRYLMPDAVWKIILETECYAEEATASP
jgi:nicotinate-nucleotide adenylyltransferase